MGSTYPLMNKLQSLASKSSNPPVPLPTTLATVVSPFVVTAWAEELASHPDAAFRDFLLSGIEHGFRIGHESKRVNLKSNRRNLASAADHPEVIQEYLSNEISNGRIGPTSHFPQLAKSCHVSPFGVIPQKAKPSKWRLIMDLSSPMGHSVNDGIDKELAGLSYVSIDDVIRCILQVGRGAKLAKIDIKQAYRNVPVHPEDRHLLGMAWNDEIYLDKVLPFGLRSAPIIFTAVADGIQWIIPKKGVQHLFHYLDDFITVGPATSNSCEENLKTIMDTCSVLGVPLEKDKTEGPSTCTTFLGMELDTLDLIVRLPRINSAGLNSCCKNAVAENPSKSAAFFL